MTLYDGCVYVYYSSMTLCHVVFQDVVGMRTRYDGCFCWTLCGFGILTVCFIIALVMMGIFLRIGSDMTLLMLTGPSVVTLQINERSLESITSNH